MHTRTRSARFNSASTLSKSPSASLGIYRAGVHARDRSIDRSMSRLPFSLSLCPRVPSIGRSDAGASIDLPGLASRNDARRARRLSPRIDRKRRVRAECYHARESLTRTQHADARILRRSRGAHFPHGAAHVIIYQ